MAKRQRLLSRILLFTAFILVFAGLANADLETQLLTDVSPSSGYAPYLQTNWYGSTAIAGKGYCVILSPSSGNSDLYLLDSSFNLVSSSKNTGLTADKIWYGQAVAGAFHLAGFGAANPSSNYTIQIITSPCVKSVSPVSALPGALITLTGFGFGDTKGTSYVKFGAVTATNYLSWTNTQIKVYLPSGVSSGVNQIVAYVNSKASNPSNFTVIGGASSEGTMWRYDLARTGNYPNGPTVKPLNLKWSSYGKGSPVIANNIVYLGGESSGLAARSAIDGTLKWTYSGQMTTPAIANGVVYAGDSGNDTICALDANTGAIKWKYLIGYNVQFYSSVAVSNGMVYIGDKCIALGMSSAQSKIYALDANTGALKWSYVTGAALIASPTIANDLVYIIPEGGKISALDANTGVLKWSYTPTGTGYFTTPIVSNSVLYAVGVKPTPYTTYKRMSVFALDANTGALKWNYIGDEESANFQSATMGSSPALSGNTLYFGGLFTEVYALDIITRTLKWSYKSGWLVNKSFALSSPAISNNFLYVLGGSGIYTGLLQLDAETGANPSFHILSNQYQPYSPAISDKKVFISIQDGQYWKLYCYGE